MAVYKATYCYPFLNAVDIRVGLRDSSATPTQYLKCKVDTSNKDVTGYKLRILDADNNVIFDPEKISPISELHITGIWESRGTNSGINGTYLQIPFFQNYGAKKLTSYNAVYYRPKYIADRIILSTNLGAEAGSMSDIANWKLETSTGYLVYDWPSGDLETLAEEQRNLISLDGELLMIGDVILVVSDSVSDENKTGLWKVSKRTYQDGSKVNETILIPLNNIGTGGNKVGIGEMATVLRGTTFHNSVWQCEVSGTSTKFSKVLNANLWCDYAGNELPGFGVDGYTLKWEITLYQGNGDIVGTSPSEITYGNISYEWLDMTLTSGKILGSTPERVQIASDDTTNDDIEIFLPEGQDGTLVLQTRYMDMMNLYDSSTGQFRNPDIFNGNRVYVQTYDSAYGHAYPLTDSLENTVLQSATHVQFFKHSNNPEDILNTDMVDFDINQNIEFNYYNTGKYKTYEIEEQGVIKSWKMYKNYTTEADWLADTKASERLIVIEVTTIEGHSIELQSQYPTLESGNTILLTNQDNPKENGVYEFYMISDGVDDTEDGKAVKDVTYYYCLKRAASYNTWASYIGKVLYSNFSKRNIESLANAGTMTLWNPQSTTSGDSKLFFTNEMPILLFPQKFSKNSTYNLLDSVSNYPDTTTGLTSLIDSQFPQVGNIILYKNGKAAQVTAVVDNTYSITAYPQGNTGTDQLIYILDGKQHGHRMYNINNLNQPDWSCYTAKILKNSDSFTYISPFTNLQKDMKIKLSNNKQVVLYNGGDKTSWLTIKKYTDNDKKLFRIQHEKIAITSPGVENKNNGTYGLISWSSFGEDGVPWKYEVRTFFRSSDENPFYAYESPYIILYKQGQQFSELSMTGVNATFEVPSDTIVTTYDEFLVDKAPLEGEEYYTVAIFADHSAITGRAVTLSGVYRQFQQASWESYRWVLLDSEGNQLQDTGKRYDKDMQVTFYGLANDTDTTNVYYAVLYVEDDLQNVLQYTIRLEVLTATQQTLPVPFTAEFDCKTHSVILNYQDTGIAAPSINIGGDTIQVYSDSSNYPDVSLWDSGIYYDNTNYNMQTTNIGNSDQPQVDYRKGSTVSQYVDGEKMDFETYNVSNSINYGVVYSNYFTRQGLYTEATDNSQLTLVEQTKNGEEVGEFYFDTEVKLNDNFCGNIVEVNVEATPDGAPENPAPESGSEEVLKGYLTFAIELPDNFTNITANTLDSKRNKPILRVTKNKNSDTPAYQEASKYWTFKDGDTDNNLELYPITDGIKTLYYMQESSYSPTGDVEFLHTSFSSGNRELWYFKRGNKYLTCKNKFLGNLNLASQKSLGQYYSVESTRANAPSYWVENRAYLYRDRNNADAQYFYNNQKWHYADTNRSMDMTEDGYQKWPTENDETTSYWNEKYSSGNDNMGGLYPNTWDEITTSVQEIVELVPHDRHSHLSTTADGKENWFRITMWINDIEEIYNNINTLTASGVKDTFTSKGVDYDAWTITLTVSDQDLGKIRIIPKSSGETE